MVVVAGVVAASAFAVACAVPSEEVGDSDQAASAGVNQEIAQLRQTFGSARATRPTYLTTKTGAAKYRWSCTERSAGRGKGSTKPVTYEFVARGDAVINEGTGFSKQVAPDPATDATLREYLPRAVFLHPETLGSPEMGQETDTYEIFRHVASTGDLVIERVLSPASKEAVDEAAKSYDRSLYDSDRGFAVAYVTCAVADRVIEAEGVDWILWDDCRDEQSTNGLWASMDMHSSFDRECRASSDVLVPATAAGKDATATFGLVEGTWLRLRYGRAEITVDGAQLRIAGGRTVDGEAGSAQREFATPPAEIVLKKMGSKVVVTVGEHTAHVELFDPAAPLSVDVLSHHSKFTLR
jgi:hypothetical protein